ncbi:MAG: fimbria/pilus outer membrane usher protein [Moraxellaceae bacterium]|nr:fimbria/pilus outer membrane usher protein [Moraxellaceae bacterium]
MKQGAGHRQPALVRVPVRIALGTAIACVLLAWSSAHAGPSAPADAEFDTSMLAGASGGASQPIDLSRFERGNVVAPGIYRLDLYLDGQWSGAADVRFAIPAGEADSVACFSQSTLDQLGLPRDKFSDAARLSLADANACVAIGDLIPGATVTYDQSELRLDVTVPQAWRGYRARGYVGPEQWDPGVTSALLNYNLNAYHTRSGGVDQTAGYLGLNAGLNLGAWHLRQDSSLTWQSALGERPSDHRWQSIATYARRDIAAWQAQLTLGDSYTSGEMFDSVGVRGVQLATDDRMLPDSLRGYAPTVRGVAETNARVSIRQNGVLLYETTVSPGPFSIDDLYATGYGGDLDVIVTEADGRVRQFMVPYAAVPQQLRPGTYRFSVAAGTVHDDGTLEEPMIVQATLQRGLTNMVTGYGGAIGSEGYAAALGGVSLNTTLGALAVDLTGARTKLPTQATDSGMSLRTTYSKMLPASGTSFSLASYRYSTSGYYSLRDALVARDRAFGHPAIDEFALDPTQALPGVLTPEQREALLGGRDANVLANVYGLDRQKNRFDITLNQRLGQTGGTLFATASTRDYWNRDGSDLQYQLGYNNRYRLLGYSVSASRLRDIDGRYSNQFFVSLSIPLGTSPRAPSMTAGLVHDTQGQNQTQVTLAGTAGDDSQLAYGVNVSDSDAVGTSANLNANYRAGFGIATVSYGHGNDYSQASAGLAGTVVAYPGGITIGQPAGDTFAVVVAPHAAGARVASSPGVKLNGSGRALVPYLTPYNRNTIELDPKGLPLDVQLSATSAHVAPHSGSVALVTFNTSHGRSVLARVRLADGQPLPFGAEVSDAEDRNLGVVGQGGRILLRGVEDKGDLQARWQDAEGTDRSCRIHYQMPASDGKRAEAYQQIESTCGGDAVAPAQENG